ncbi:MAG: hypothetical protein HYX78_04315 [Armatimonadetes bacterium]|nr:hypothetical protein [Armatimonadota bacterium]
MTRSLIIGLVVLLIVSAIILSGCKDDRTMISRILERPDRYLDRNVVVAGEVTRTYGVDLIITELGAYQVDDGSGKIWVLTRTGVPREGSVVGLKGRVESGIKVGRELVGAVIREERRRMR